MGPGQRQCGFGRDSRLGDLSVRLQIGGLAQAEADLRADVALTPRIGYPGAGERETGCWRAEIAVVAAEAAQGRVWTTNTVPVSVWQPLVHGTPARATPIFSLDAGAYFDRDTTVKGKDYLQTIEPRLFYLNVPYTSQDDMPLFDTQPLTFSWGQLFRDNRYSGADRQADANQLTLALSTRMIRQSDGRERFSASLGQIRYFDESRVRIPGEPITEKGRSAWVADANYAPTDR